MSFPEPFKTHDGLKLITKTWIHPQARSNIVLVHGYLEHCRRYEHAAKYFNDHGYNVFAYDQRGHGLSEGKPSYIKQFENYILDLKQFLDHIEIYNKAHFYILCHSMGGLVTLSYLLNEKNIPDNLQGVIFSAPFIQPSKDLAPALQKISRILGLIAPWLPTKSADPAEISRDLQYVKNYAEDPLIYHGRVHAGSARQLLNQMKKIRPLYCNMTLPFLVIHGTDDKMAELEGSQNLYLESQSTDKKIIKLKDFKHEVMNEIGKKNVLQSIANWLDERTISGT
ncbi:MAG: lysophospholipase [Bacteroidia bacterium]|nr:lysophospholipase [Bacteroidia bacterium]